MSSDFLGRRSATPRFLLVEDDEVAAVAAEEQLLQVWPQARVSHVMTIEEALSVAAEPWDVALLDLGLPRCEGLQALYLLAAQATHVPIVVLTAQDEEELAVRALREGAQDYLSKRNIDETHLGRSIRYAVERHRILSRLRSSETNLLNLVDSHGDGVLVVNSERTVIYANAPARRQLDSERNGLVGRPSPIEGPATGIVLSAADGGKRVVDVWETTVDWRGSTARMIVLRDVTERHQAEQLRLQMQHNERMAAIGILSAGIAHEINNPLTYVLGCLEILRRDLKKNDSAGERASESKARSTNLSRSIGLVDRAVNGVERVVAIVRNLGKFSRADDEIELKATRLDSVLRTALETADPHLRHRARTIFDVDEDLLVAADAGPLTQVFVNLLVNAAHAIEEGHVDGNSVSIRAQFEAGQVVVSIVDTGRGIRKDQIARLFDPFFTTKTAGEGTGLGLYVCRSIVESFGGKIRVESEEGRGTCFEVYLEEWFEAPRSRQIQQVEQAPMSVRSVERRLARARVLVVDDEEFIRQAIKMTLPDRCKVVLAQSAREAIGMLEEGQQFDLILCDIVMDDGSGLELRDWIEEMRPELVRKLLFMSGGSLGESSSLPFEQEVLRKPFRVNELLTRVGGALTSVPPPPLEE